MKLEISRVLQAQRRIAPFIHHTPLVHSGFLSELTGGEVWLKLECQQPTGSFKVRGALNRVGSMSDEQRARGLVTGSAGNHGLGVALAARAWGPCPTEICVPATAPRAKLERLRRFPVTIHPVGTTYEDAHQAALAIARETGATYIPAYDDLDVIAGQGTIGMEILTDLPEADLVLVPIGGGGLIAGIATTLKKLHPACQVIGLQPEASPSALLSLQNGVAYDPYDHAPTIADGLAGGFGALPLAIAGALIDQVLLAREPDLRQAIFKLLDQEQLVVEASGAITIAPLLNGQLDVARRTVVCVLSGGNLETDLLREILVEFQG